MSAALLFHNVSVNRGAFHVLVDVDINVATGQRVGIVGPNGVGKSTLVRTRAGQLKGTTSR